MTAQEVRFIVILVINLIVTLIYLNIGLFLEKNNKIGCWVRAAVMLLCPVGGALILFVSYFIYHLFFYKEVDLADLVCGRGRRKSYVQKDNERGRSRVLLEEVVTFADKEEDSLNNFHENVQKIYLQIKENTEDHLECVHLLIDYMNPILKQQARAGMEEKSQVDILDDVCEMLYKANPKSMDAGEFGAVSLRLLEVSEFARSQKWCDRAALQYSDALSTYICRLKLYFSMGEREAFFRVLNELKQSDVYIDRETMEMIGVFM